MVAAPLSASAQDTDKGWVEEFYPELAPRESPQAPPPEPVPKEPVSEPAPEEPALQLKLDDAAVEVVPPPPRTPDGYTLEEMDVRVRRAKIGIGSSAAAVLAGGMFFGFGFGESFQLGECLFDCPPTPKRYDVYLWTGTALMVGGFAGMVASGILLRRRKRDRDSLREARYGRSQRVQWDLESSRFVF